MTENYQKAYDKAFDFVEKKINERFDALQGEVPELLLSGMKYAVIGGGKRIRPVFALIGAEIAGGKMEDAEDVAVAIEFMHSYSLVHDDLPCMDDDTLRRGKPCTHVAFGEGMGVLIGDALLNCAFETLFFAGDKKPEFANRTYKIFGKYTGSLGMVAGQCVDITQNKDYSIEYLYSQKTSALLKAALLCGASIGGASEELLAKLERYAEFVGLAFQITDDILDVLGDEKILGKNIGSDDEQDKDTYLKIYGLEKAREDAKLYVEKAIDSIKDVENNYFLIEFAKKIIGRNK